MGLVPGIRGEIGFGTVSWYSREKMRLVLGTLKSAEYQHPDLRKYQASLGYFVVL